MREPGLCRDTETGKISVWYNGTWYALEEIPKWKAKAELIPKMLRDMDDWMQIRAWQIRIEQIEKGDRE